MPFPGSWDGGADRLGAVAQEPPSRAAAAEVALRLRQADGVKRVLMIGAHPDDEDTALLAALARGAGAQVAYLSLTRGEGGQNLLGGELEEGLGLLRTAELLAARRVDGAEQFFTRAYDFGYSRDAEETFRHWPRDSLLSDVVWVIRTFRPQVVVSVFSGTPADGHGQHQVAGIVARQAFELAGDAGRFPEHARLGADPWEPQKLYRRTWRDPERSTLAVPTGGLDPLLGRSHFQVAMEGRSLHRSQDFGVARPPGPFETRLRLLAGPLDASADTSLFAGVDTTLAGLAGRLPPAAAEAAGPPLAGYRQALEEARGRLDPLAPYRSATALAGALELLRMARQQAEAAGAAAGGEWSETLARRERLLSEALLDAVGLRVVARADAERLVPSLRFGVEASVWNGGAYGAAVEAPVVEAPAGWEVAGLPADQVAGDRWPGPAGGRPAEAVVDAAAGEAARLGADRLVRWGYGVRVAADAPPSVPYYLRATRQGALYAWPLDATLRARPGDPPPLHLSVRLTLELPGRAPVTASVRRPVRYRGVDKAAGEFWRPLLVFPPASLALSPGVLVWPAEDGSPRTLSATVRSHDPGRVQGSLRAVAPPGWTVRPESARVELAAGSTSATVRFELAPPTDGEAGGGEVSAELRTAAGSRLMETLTLVDGPHVEPVPWVRPARSRWLRLPVQVAEARRVAYVSGSGDEVAEAIAQLGLTVEVLEPGRLGEVPLDAFDVVVLGVRAYEVRSDLAATNDRLLRWVREGGVLIVQYNKYEYVEGGFAPLEVDMARPHDRVVDETAPVRLLAPHAPALARPNRIGPADFDGWVQERGLYFLSSWDPRFTPLLEMADPGRPPSRGGLVVAPLGRGLYVYTGLAFFRQLPAAVPGAYRLLANLLSLDPAAWHAWEAAAEAGER